jgi:RHS repeat-associated protein
LQTRTLDTGSNDFILTYNYLASSYTPSGATSSLISSLNYNGASSLSYTYYNNGYIHTVSDGTNTIHYKYDGIGQLLQTDDPTDDRGGVNGSVWVNVYDIGGNITSKKLYTFDSNNEDLTDNTLIHTYTFTYNATWKDKLASYDGNAVTTDAIGNTTGYNGWTYTWEAGRQLKQMSNGSTTLQFKYNDSGLRTQKINGATTTKYYWAGSNISHMTSGSDSLHFWYDAAGLPTMVTYNGYNFYYKHNLQGDIIGLMDSAGNPVVSYTYDSWGKQLSCTGTLANTLGAANPLRYRGYIYDNETGLYYLQNRYYNPDWGRFINADGQINMANNLSGINLFVYCSNSPINYDDPNGLYQIQSCDDLTDIFGSGYTIEVFPIASQPIRYDFIADQFPIYAEVSYNTSIVISDSGDSSKPVSAYARIVANGGNGEENLFANFVNSSVGVKINHKYDAEASSIVDWRLGLCDTGGSVGIKSGDTLLKIGSYYDFYHMNYKLTASSISQVTVDGKATKNYTNYSVVVDFWGIATVALGALIGYAFSNAGQQLPYIQPSPAFP